MCIRIRDEGVKSTFDRLWYTTDLMRLMAENELLFFDMTLREDNLVFVDVNEGKYIRRANGHIHTFICIRIHTLIYTIVIATF